MSADAGLRRKLLMRESGLFASDHEQIADGFDFERKWLEMEEKPRFSDVCYVDCALCKSQMRSNFAN